MNQSSTSSAPSRRALARGVAWSAPSLVIAGTAPATAASVPVTMAHITRFSWYDGSSPVCARGDSLELNTAVTAGTTFTTTTAATKITDVHAYFWSSRSDNKWAPMPANSGCWTVPTKDGVTQVNQGVTYYRYATFYTCPITVTPGTTRLQPYAWQSQCYNYPSQSPIWLQAKTARRQAFATVNGKVQTTDTGFFVIKGA